MPPPLNFKAIAEGVDIYDVAKLLGLTVVKDRATCPVCDSERALQFFPETNSFQCHASGNTRNSDCIALYAHIRGYEGMYRAAKEIADQFRASGIVPTVPDRATVNRTTPQKHLEEGTSTSGASKAAAPVRQRQEPFDPDAYAAKLQFTEEVAALGITAEDAAKLGIGFMSTGLHRGRVVFTIRNIDGSIAGFVGANGSDLKLPQRWITSTVVPLRRPA